MARTLAYDSAGKPYYLPPPIPTAGDVDSETQAKLDSAERIAREESIARENVAKIQASVQRNASDAALRLYEKKRDDTPPFAYNKGGPVIKGEFKHAHPTYSAYAKSGDSSLLAKGRK